MAVSRETEKSLGRHFDSPFVLLETVSFDKENAASFLFRDFCQILTFHCGDNVELFFKKIENLLNKGYWLCGYFSYEFGYFLEPALYALRPKNNTPLVWLGVCRQPKIIRRPNVFSFNEDAGCRSFCSNYKIKNIKPNLSQAEYSKKIKEIKYHLEQGLTYQVNFTFKVKFDFSGDAFSLYQNLKQSQPTSYTALINTGSSKIISLSPELFFRIEGEKIITRPMKGTVQRGLTLDDDKRAKRLIKGSRKIRAENLMIVDLLRNDLGKVAKRVWVPKLFDLEKYRTLHQMTSTIEAKLQDNLKLKNIFSSLFPSGSVTGAPKIKTMEIIKNLEKEPRGVYTGAVGYISPQRKTCFNVAIRTIELGAKQGELGIGGGIVYDSVDKHEYDEALLKAKFFIEGFSGVGLIESILWSDIFGYFLLDLHLKRLRNSCKYFSIPLDTGRLKRKLKNIILQDKGKFKVKLLVNIEGGVHAEKEPLEENISPLKVKLSSRRIDPKNRFLYHKTTRRALYDKERNRANKEGFWEVIFLNTQGELTEGSITNIFVLKSNQLYTPPIKCGLLPGVLREHLLSEGKAKEKVLYLKDIYQADKVYIGNSVRGLTPIGDGSLNPNPLGRSEL